MAATLKSIDYNFAMTFILNNNNNNNLTYMALLTLTHSINDLKLFCLIVRTDLLLLLYGAPPWTVRRAAPYKSLSVFVLYYKKGIGGPYSRRSVGRMLISLS